MKKVLLVLAVAGIVALSSCKKDVECCVYDGDEKVSTLESTCFSGKYSNSEIEDFESVSAAGSYSWKCD